MEGTQSDYQRAADLRQKLENGGADSEDPHCSSGSITRSEILQPAGQGVAQNDEAGDA
jgi:hypothetical protein